MRSIKEVIMNRDCLTEQEADALIADAIEAMNERLADGELPFDICEEYFGLEEDYLDQLIDCSPVDKKAMSSTEPKSMTQKMNLAELNEAIAHFYDIEESELLEVEAIVECGQLTGFDIKFDISNQ